MSAKITAIVFESMLTLELEVHTTATRALYI